MGTMIEIPIFYGEDPEAWVSWIEAFVVEHRLSDFETRQLAYGFIGGEAHTWYRDEVSRCPFYSWGELKVRLIQRFSTRVKHEKTKLEEPTWQDRIKKLDRVIALLERRYPEKAAVEEQQEEAAVSESDLNQSTSQDGGSLTSIVLVGENQPMEQNQSEVKDDPSTLKSEVSLLVTDSAIDELVCEKDKEEKARASTIDVSGEQRGKMRKKKKRWKKRETQNRFEQGLDFEAEDFSGFCVLNREGTQDQENKSQRKDHKDHSTHQVLDGRSERRNKATEKSKQWKMKVPKPRNQNVSVRRRCQRLKWQRLYIIHVLNKRIHWRFMKKKKKMRLEEHDVTYGTLYLRGKRVKMKSERGSFTKSKEWKHKAEKYKSETQRSQRESVSKLGRKRIIERRKRVSCLLVTTHQQLNRQWLLSFIKKKKCRTKLVLDKKRMKLFHMRDFAKLAEDVTFLKQGAKGKQMKFKHNHRKQKRGIKLSSYKQLTLSWNSELALELVRRYINGGRMRSKQNLLQVFLWRGDKLLQLEGIVELLRKLILAAVERKRAKSKYMRRDCVEPLMLGLTVRPLKGQGKRKKGNVKHDKMRRWKYKLRERELYLQVLQVEENGDLRFAERVKKSNQWSVKRVMVKHGFELRNRLWKPGIVADGQDGSDTRKSYLSSSKEVVAYNGRNSFSDYCITGFGEWKERSETLSDGVLGVGLSRFMRELVELLDASKGARILKLIVLHFLTPVYDFVALVLLNDTYVAFHSPKPPELWDILDHVFRPETFATSGNKAEYETYTTSPRPQQFFKLFRINAKITKVAERYQSLSKKRLKRRNVSFCFSTLRTRLISMGAVLLCVVTDEEGKELLEG